MRTPSGHKVYGMGAQYPSAATLYEAAKLVRDAGFKRWDVHSPFPIHGMDEAMGLKNRGSARSFWPAAFRVYSPRSSWNSVLPRSSIR